jgi:hypothetical protein
MKTEIVLVTPKMAKSMLECNYAGNRPLKEFRVAPLRDAYTRGEWKLTHQGIAFTTDGHLIDGQHRLTMISELPDGTEVPMVVTTGLSAETFDVIDQGKPRTIQDVYGTSEGLAAVARVFASIVNTSKSGMTPQFVKMFMDWVEPEYSMLISFSPTAVKFWSCASIRAAAVLRMKQGHNKDRIRVIYDSLIKSNIGAMPQVARLFAQQYLAGVAGSHRGFDTFCRALRVFNTQDAFTASQLHIRDVPGTIAEVRTFTLREMKKSPANAGLNVAKPESNFSWKKAA